MSALNTDNNARSTGADSKLSASPAPLNLDHILKDGINHYKKYMTKLLESEDPFTTRQIQKFHLEIKDAVLQAFDSTYTPVIITSSNSNLSAADVAQIRTKLSEAIDSNEVLSLSKSNGNSLEDTISQIQKCTSQAEEYYNETMSSYSIPTGKILKLKHTMLKFETFQKFQNLLKKQDINMEDWHKKELDHKLEVKLQQMLVKFKEEEVIPTTNQNPPPVGIPSSKTVPEDPAEEFSLLALPLNLAIYMDINTITVASSDSNFEIIQTSPSRIVFTEGQILIGAKAKEFRNSPNYFNIYELIKQQQSTSHFIYLQDFCTTLCTEEVLSLFFKSLEKETLRLKSSTCLGNVVITTAFSLISKEKERLKLSTKLAGWKNVRLLSTVLTTAIAFSKQTHYFQRKPTQRKLLLVIQYLKDAFSMGVAEIQPNSIFTRIQYGSLNIEECQTLDFIMNHAHMREKGTEEVYPNVQRCYRKCGKFIQGFIDKIKIDKVLVVKDLPDITAIDLMLQKMFAVNMEFIFVNDGPIHGASVFASREFLHFFPKALKVRDCFNSEFLVVHNEITVDKISSKVGEEERLCCKIDIVESGSIRVLEKIFDENFVEVCHFYFEASASDENYEICLFECIDEDGVYCVRVDVPKYVKGKVTRIDNLLVNLSGSDPLVGSRLDKLTQHYEEINAKSTKKEYYQLYFY